MCGIYPKKMIEIQRNTVSCIYRLMTTQCYTHALTDHPISDPQSHSVMETQRNTRLPRGNENLKP